MADLASVLDLDLITAEEGLHTLYATRKSAGDDCSDIFAAHDLVAAEMRERDLIYTPMDKAKAVDPDDPDGDGDNDSTPEGDTDHDYWSKNGKQKKALPSNGATRSVDNTTATAKSLEQWRMEKRDYSVDERRSMAGTGEAMPDGSFPIANEADLHHAISLVHLGTDPAAAQRHIIQRAKSMGMDSRLPEGWTNPDAGKPKEPTPGAHDMPAPNAPKPKTAKAIAQQITEHLVDGMRKALGSLPSDIDSDTLDFVEDLDYAVIKSSSENRYTLGPVYIPNHLDAHGEWATPEDMEKSCWEYVRETGGDRTVYLQHSPKPAGEWVGILTWPQETHARMTKSVDGVMKAETVTFPAGTPYMGVVWEPWAWEMVKAGKLTGFSMGGYAHRIEAEI